jgi:hypothetical protein
MESSGRGHAAQTWRAEMIRPVRQRRAAFAMGAVLLAGCGGPAPVASPSSSQPPTSGPVASSSASSSGTAGIAAEAWAAEICDLNADWVQASQDAAAQFPNPAQPTLAALQAVHASRRPIVVTATDRADERAQALEVFPGGRPFHDALAAELADRAASTPALYNAIAAATSVEAITQLLTESSTSGGRLLSTTTRAIARISLAAADALAAVKTGCRFFESDARAWVRGRPSVTFGTTIADDRFETAGRWPVGPIAGGEIRIEGGAMVVSLTTGGASRMISTTSIDPSPLGDVRIEASVVGETYALSGLACRANGAQRYTVQMNPYGQILIYRWSDRQELLGRRAPPYDDIQSRPLNLAMECVGGRSGQALLIAAYQDGQRVAEVVDEQPLAADGEAGLFAQTLGLPSTTRFEAIRVLVPAR